VVAWPPVRYPDWESLEIVPGLGSLGPGGSGGSGGLGLGGLPVAFCADLSPASVLGAYRRGVIPMPAPDEHFRTVNEYRYEDLVADGTIAVVGRGDPYWVAWWSPDPRPVILAGGVHLGRNEPMPRERYLTVLGGSAERLALPRERRPAGRLLAAEG
jgi:hypothetical protein